MSEENLDKIVHVDQTAVTELKPKSLGATNVKTAASLVSDLEVFGNGDMFMLLCKASSEEQGWMKSTKAMETPTGCVVQVTTQQRNPDGSYSVAEALTYVPGVRVCRKTNTLVGK